METIEASSNKVNFRDQSFYKTAKERDYNMSIFNIFKHDVNLESLITNILNGKEINYLYAKNSVLQYIKNKNNVIKCLEDSYDKFTKNINDLLILEFNNNNFIDIFLNIYKGYTENSKTIKTLFNYFNSHMSNLQTENMKNNYSIIDIIKNDYFYNNVISNELYKTIQDKAQYITDYEKYKELTNIELYFKIYNKNTNELNFDNEINAENICVSLDSLIRNINNSYEIEKDIDKIRNYIKIGTTVAENNFENRYFVKMMDRIKDGFDIKIEEELLTSFKRTLLKLKLTNYVETNHLLGMLKRIKIRHQTNKYRGVSMPNFNNVKAYVGYNSEMVKQDRKLPLPIEIYMETIENVYKQLYSDRIFAINYEDSKVNMDVEIDGKIVTINVSLNDVIKNNLFL